MSHLAFRRNVGDDSIVAGFAREVGSPEILRMLALLTAADVAAVGPGTWTSWKADLLGGLSMSGPATCSPVRHRPTRRFATGRPSNGC